MLLPHHGPFSQESLETILDNIQGGIITCVFDTVAKSSQVTYINRGWSLITGYSLGDLSRLKQGNPQSLIHPQDRELTDADYLMQLREHPHYELLYRLICKDGSVIWVIDKGTVTPLADGRFHNQSILTEVTKLKEREERLNLLSQSDPMTNLYNKTTFAMLAKETLMLQSNRSHALLMVDVDNFKLVNDSHGHAFGDEVLMAVADQLRNHSRSRDILGRVGGDEFMILLSDIHRYEDAMHKAETLCSAIRHLRFSNCPTPITTSIGVALFEPPGLSFESLSEQADKALYRAKHKGKNCYDFWPDHKSSI